MKELKAVIFDLDGTLIDSVDAHMASWTEALKKVGIKDDRGEVKRLVGMSARDISKALIPEGREEKRGELRLLKRRLYYEEFFPSRVVPFPDAVETLKQINDKGLKCAIASSIDSKKIRMIAQKFGFDRYIQAIVGADEVERGKPNPEIMLEASSKLGVIPESCIVVGDTAYDVAAGRAAGMITMAVVRETTVMEALIAQKPDWIVMNLSELMDVLRTVMP